MFGVKMPNCRDKALIQGIFGLETPRRKLTLDWNLPKALGEPCLVGLVGRKFYR